MPELPEMERYRNILGKNLTGKIITGVEVNREKSINIPVQEFIDQVANRTVVAVKRRAKHLIFELDSGNSLLLHLMLGGWMFLGNEEESPDRTKQVILSFGEVNLYFIGLRLGYLHLLEPGQLQEKLAGYGPEPLAIGLDEFKARIRMKKGTLKSLFVDQSFIAGIGNCYSDEICFKARLNTAKKSASLTETQVTSLFSAMKPVLLNALEIGGYMDDPLFPGDTKTGQYNDHTLVYDRENQPCKRCGTAITKIKVSSKKSFVCPNCQED
ncbi:formamidopyrimidine-DNA glycosylase [Bacillus sp. FJAT-27225]|uniref:Fpg/Nei family DNA glycosylase n=1 Tax=Bacillus sp. FJAT-27225 TaxID=1743144 RepID=UPI00080C3027|nr:DNA-formamidopyrimidine glycosylase family protein [Bacillus sp. FJAT-27225]OCA90666.1 formamidopyrimidine-DNA glycosylase [Bacillus sp. FJAT-27225]